MGTKGAAGLKPDGSGESGPGRSTESLGPIGTGPLQGFNKGSREERLGDTPPMMIAKAEPQDLESRKMRDENRRELADIYFAFDKWILSEEGKKNLAESAGFLKQNPGAKIVIEGYCDERGNKDEHCPIRPHKDKVLAAWAEKAKASAPRSPATPIR